VCRHLRVQAGLGLGLTLALAGGVLAASAARPALATPARASARHIPVPTRAVRQLLLINGDRLVVTAAAGRTSVGLQAAHRPDALVRLPYQGQLLEVPTVALPYLGRGLSPALFEVGALQKAESHGRLPVQVSFTGHRPAIPGLTDTRLGAAVTDGYLTPASAAAFGAALRRQYLADQATGRYGRDGLFAGGVTITLPGSPRLPAAPAVAAKVRKYQLTVHGTDLNGRPDNGGTIFVSSTDNAKRFFQVPSSFSHGIARFRVPAGHYWALAIFGFAAERIVVRPQFTVPAKPTTLRLAAASATSEFTTRTPRRAVSIYNEIDFVRGERTGHSEWFGVGWEGGTGWVNPTHRKPTEGWLRTYSWAVLLAPHHRVPPAYVYNLNFPGPRGIIPSQHFTVRRAGLAAVTQRFYQDPATRKGGWFTPGATPAQLPGGGPIVGFRMPAVVTQYLTGGPRLLWELASYYVLKPDVLYLAVGDLAGYRSYRDGRRQTQDWNEYPLHPQPNTRPAGTPGFLPTQASAARIGNKLRLIMTPFSDNQAGHLGAGFDDAYLMPETGSYTVDQNGRLIASGSALLGIPGIRLSARPSVIRFTLTATRQLKLFPLSLSSQTTWTWRSAPDPSARVPAGWYCFRKHGYQRQCAVQPLMTLNYGVTGLSLAGQTRPGRQVIEVTAGHLQPGRQAAITGARAQVSFDGGHTWHTASVTAQGHGRFRVGFHAPAGVDVTLRVSASDADGGSISETITNGYAISAAPATRVGPVEAGRSR
jgi:hypothetical protein